MSQQTTKPKWYGPLNLIVGLVAVLVAAGAVLWVTTGGLGTNLDP